MNTRIITALSLGIALAIAPAVGALADDAPVDPLTVSETTSDVVVEEVIEETKLDICHSGSAVNWTWISPDASGYNGHQHHDADIYGLGEAACLAKNPVDDPPPVVVDETPFVLIGWPMASWIDDRHPTWPQGTKAGLAAPFIVDLATRNLGALDATLAALTVPCETSVQYQIDGNFDTPEVRAAIAGGFLDGPGDPAEALWGGGWGEAYKLVKIDGPACPVIEFCETEGTLPTATNLDPQGWVIKPGRGEFVEGGLHLFSTADSSGWAYKMLNTPLSQVGDLSTNYSDETDQYTFGVILTLDGPTPGHAFGAQQIHYDEDGRYWTDQPGILGNGAILKGGYWETYDLHADLISDVQIANIVLYVNAGHGGLVIHSQDHSCGTQPFDKVPVPTREPKVVVFEGEYTGPTPTCEVQTTEQERVVTTTRIPFKLIIVNAAYELVEDAEHAEVISTIIEKRTLQYEGEPCPTVVTEEPPVETPPTSTPQGSLPNTGADGFGGLWVALALMFVGAIAFLFKRFVFTSHKQ